MPSLAEVINSATEFEFEGRKYTFVELDVEHMGKYTEWLRQRALITAEQLFRNSSTELMEAKNQILRDSAAGVYDYGNKVCIESLGTLEGKAKHLELSAMQAGGDLDINDARELVLKKQLEVNKIVNEVIAKDPKGFATQAKKLLGSEYSAILGTRRSASARRKSKKSR